MLLYLDDVRNPPKGSLCARTAAEAIRLLEAGGITAVSLDHDLGPVEAGTGYHVAVWIEEHAADGTQAPLSWYVHSANPVGRDKMEQALRSADRFWFPAPT